LSDYEAYLDLAQKAAFAAGRIIREGAARPIDVQSKGLRNLLTDVDLAAERAILDILAREVPDHDVLTEESPPEARRSRYCWVIDPLDGTGNFAHGYPCFSTSIAFTQDEEPIVGVVYDPIREHFFAAVLGQGATLNGEPLHVSGTENLLEAFVGTDWTRDAASRERNVQMTAQLMPHINVLRVCGSAALSICYVGAGWWDAYWHVGLQPWDAAAGALIVRETGGQATDLLGQRWQLHSAPFLASNGKLHKEILEGLAVL
jgi:myo-inositol-1(or 4)-monophosphatase